MSTNYYATFIANRIDFEGTAYKTKETLHIGKSSGGWVFNWRGYKSDDERIDFLCVLQIATVEDWIKALQAAESIEDEYGQEMTFDEFMSYALSCNNGRNHALEYPNCNWAVRYNDSVYAFSTGDWS